MSTGYQDVDMLSGRSSLLTIIVAAAQPGFGIGKGGALPWPMLKGEMGFFARVTKRVDSQQVSEDNRIANAVIMGRKTWNSIPGKLRPLKGRMNVVVSSTMQQPPPSEDRSFEGPYVTSSLENALETLRNHQALPQSASEGVEHSGQRTHQHNPPPDLKICRTFIIGGSSLYEAALKLDSCDRLLLTKINKSFDCDVFFPLDPDSTSARQHGWRQRSAQQWAEWTGEMQDGRPNESHKEESDVPYEFCLYERQRDG